MKRRIDKIENDLRTIKKLLIGFYDSISLGGLTPETSEIIDLLKEELEENRCEIKKGDSLTSGSYKIEQFANNTDSNCLWIYENEELLGILFFREIAELLKKNNENYKT